MQVNYRRTALDSYQGFRLEPLQRPYGVTFWREDIMDSLQLQFTVRLDYDERLAFAYRRVPLRTVLDPAPGLDTMHELVIEAHDLMYDEIFSTLTGRY